MGVTSPPSSGPKRKRQATLHELAKVKFTRNELASPSGTSGEGDEAPGAFSSPSPAKPSSSARTVHTTQATLHDMKKVVSSSTSSYYNVSAADILKLRDTLDDPDTSNEDITHALRQLSAMVLPLSIFEDTKIGLSVRQISKKHADGDIKRLAATLRKKWMAEMKDGIRRENKKERSNLRGFLNSNKSSGWKKGG